MTHATGLLSLLLLPALVFISRPGTVQLTPLTPMSVNPAADTVRFPATYATALPTLNPAQWEQDYSRYQRFLTPQIRRTQMGISYAVDGVQIWRCQPSASPHAQLDTTTRVQDPARLLGSWHSVANRIITHIDSFSVRDQKFYRSARVLDRPDHLTLQVTDQKFTLDSDAPKNQHLSKSTLR